MLNPAINPTHLLSEIVANKQQEVNARKQHCPLADFNDQLSPSNRSLATALSNNQSDFIFECKKASPSRGLIREHFNLEEILNIYKKYASAVSVLTDKKYFQGQLNYLSQASKQISQPILCKDFFIDPYQVYEARKYGADAILLMLSILDDNTYTQLANIAEKLNLDVLTEVHDEQEVKRAVKLNAKIIGINNRNLNNLKVDRATTKNLAPLIKKLSPNSIIISESGIQNHQQIQSLSNHVNGFLIGSSIMAEADIEFQCKSLLFGNVKICGIKTPEQANIVNEQGANYCGLIFYPPSKRNISFEQANKIINNQSIRFVGVFVDEAISKMVKYAKSLKLYAIQLHGNEPIEKVKQLRHALDLAGLAHTKIWQALSPEKYCQRQKLNTKVDIDRYLLDNFTPNANGGSGKTFDWRLLNSIDSSELILAGGINLNNVKQLNNIAKHAIDLSSGVEDDKGDKSQQKISQLMQLLRA